MNYSNTVAKLSQKFGVKYFVLILMIVLFAFSDAVKAQDLVDYKSRREVIKKETLDNLIRLKIMHSQDVFNWNDANDLMIWSALVQSDSLAIVGYQPTVPKPEDRNWETRDINSDDWENARLSIIHKINSWAEENLSAKDGRDRQIVMERIPFSPFMIVRLSDYSLISEIRKMPEFANIEVGTYSLESEYKIGESACSGDGEDEATEQVIDYDHDGDPSTAPYGVSWHTVSNKVMDVWEQGSNQGDNIKIALMDTGLDFDNPQFANDVWVSGGSTGRAPIEYKGFHTSQILGGTNFDSLVDDINNSEVNLVFDGVYDDCGHGTSMSATLAGPHTTNGRTGGIAPRADLVSYRVTNDVLLDELEEKIGIYLGLFDVASDPEVKVISMSLGKLFHSDLIAEAVRAVVREDKLMFCAAGTSSLDVLGVAGDITNVSTIYDLLVQDEDSFIDGALSFLGISSISDMLNGEQDAFAIVIFPASMPETVAITGQSEATNQLGSDCIGGAKVDFSPIMEREYGVFLDIVNPPGYAMESPTDSEGDWMKMSSGSSCGTATAAGIAALIWGEMPQASSGTILNAMLAGVQRNNNGFISRDSHLGMGMIDAAKAVESLPNQYFDPLLAHEVMVNITKIEFPDIGDGLLNFENEWAIMLNGNEYYAKVKNVGSAAAMSFEGIHPLACMKDNEYGAMGPLMRFPVGTFTIDETMGFLCSIHEDDSDGFTVDFGLPIRDDHYTFKPVLIDPMVPNGSFTIDLADTDEVMTFYYDLDFEAVSILCPAVSNPSVCYGQDIVITAYPVGADQYTFFDDQNKNFAFDAGEPILQTGSDNVYSIQSQFIGGVLRDNDIVGVTVTDYAQSVSETTYTDVSVIPLPVGTISPNPTADGLFDFQILNTVNDYENYTYQWKIDLVDATANPVSLGTNITSYANDNLGIIEDFIHYFGDTEGTVVTKLAIYNGAEEVHEYHYPHYLSTVMVGCYFDENGADQSFTTDINAQTKTVTVSTGYWDGYSDWLKFTYDWGDGTSSVFDGPGNRTHTYAQAGLYSVSITVRDQFHDDCELNITKSVRLGHTFINTNFFTPLTELDINGSATVLAEEVDSDFIGPSLSGGSIKGGGKVGPGPELVGGKAAIEELPEYLLFPNPCPGYVNVVQNNPQLQLQSIEVFDVMGRRIQQFDELTNEHITLDNLPSGILFIQLSSVNKETGKYHRETKQIVSSN